MIEATGISETSRNFYQTALHNHPRDSHLYTYSLLMSFISGYPVVGINVPECLISKIVY
jgi:hypothetical protein